MKNGIFTTRRMRTLQLGVLVALVVSTSASELGEREPSLVKQHEKFFKSLGDAKEMIRKKYRAGQYGKCFWYLEDGAEELKTAIKKLEADKERLRTDNELLRTTNTTLTTESQKIQADARAAILKMETKNKAMFRRCIGLGMLRSGHTKLRADRDSLEKKVTEISSKLALANQKIYRMKADHAEGVRKAKLDRTKKHKPVKTDKRTIKNLQRDLNNFTQSKIETVNKLCEEIERLREYIRSSDDKQENQRQEIDRLRGILRKKQEKQGFFPKFSIGKWFGGKKQPKQA